MSKAGSKTGAPAEGKSGPGRIVIPNEMYQDAARAAAQEAVKARLHVEDAKFDALMEIVYAVEALTDTIMGVVVAVSGMEKDTRVAIQNYVLRSAEKRAEARGTELPAEEGEKENGREG